jgi:hypothetical protein
VLSLSGGFGVTGIEERDYRFVTSVADQATGASPGKDTGDDPSELVNRIGVDASSEQLTGVFLLNARLFNPRKDNIHFIHFSVGTSVDLDSPDSSVAFGYLAGLSYSFKDAFYLTGGLHAARVHELAPGFELGDPQIDGVETPPTVKSWDYDWILAVTFKLK